MNLCHGLPLPAQSVQNSYCEGILKKPSDESLLFEDSERRRNIEFYVYMQGSINDAVYMFKEICGDVVCVFLCVCVCVFVSFT